MTVSLKIFFLSLVESISEFLPISSSSHLIFADKFFLKSGLINNDFFMIFIQLGSLLALTFYYRSDIKNIFKETSQLKKEGYITFFNLLNAFIVSGIVGFLIKQIVHLDFIYSAYALIFFGIMMILLQKRQNYGRIMHLWEIPPLYAFLIGVSQGLSAFPGVSRLGITLIAGILLNLRKDIAIKFSFLLALPTMFAASVYELIKLIVRNEAIDLKSNIIGFFFSLILSLVFIRPLIFLLQKINIKYFGYYRIIFATIILFFLKFISI
jgi:undecaprenyl-diphosphatase